MVIGPSGKNRSFQDSTRKRPMVGRTPPNKGFPLQQHRHRTSLDLRLQISRHLLTDSPTLEQSTSLSSGSSPVNRSSTSLMPYATA